MFNASLFVETQYFASFQN